MTHYIAFLNPQFCKNGLILNSPFLLQLMIKTSTLINAKRPKLNYVTKSVLLLLIACHIGFSNLWSQIAPFEITVTSEQMQEFFGLGISIHKAKNYFIPANLTIRQKLFSETFSAFNTITFWSYIEESSPATRDQLIELAEANGLKRIIMNPTQRDPDDSTYAAMEHANQQLADLKEYLDAGYPIYGYSIMNKLNTNESGVRRVTPSWPVEFLKLFKFKLDSAGITGIKIGGPSTIEWSPYIDPTLHGAAHPYSFQPGDNMMYLNTIKNDTVAFGILDAIDIQSYGWSHTAEVQEIARQNGKEQWVCLSATDGENNDNGNQILGPISAANLLSNINHGVVHWNYWVWDQLVNFTTGELNKRGKVLQHVGKSFKEGAIVRKCTSSPFVYSEQMFWNYYDVNNPSANRQPELVAAAAKNKDNSFVVGLVNLTGIHAQHFYSRYYPGEAAILNVTVKIEEFKPNEVALFDIQRTNSDGTYALQGQACLMKNKMKTSVGPQALVILKANEIMESSQVLLDDYRPDGTNATIHNNQFVKVSWTDNAPNETGYTIERRLKNGDTFVVAGTVSANFSEFIDESVLSKNSIYEYRVTANSSVNIGDKVFPDTLSSGLTEVFIDIDNPAEFHLADVNLKVFPNPSNGIFRLKSDTFNELCKMELYNTSGILVMQKFVEMNQDIDLSSLPGGIYNMKIQTEKEFVILKLMIID